jgi:hypothetical protein
MTYPIKMPDYGGGGGSSFDDFTRYGSNPPVAIRAITVRATTYVEYLEPLYVLTDGSVLSVPHGGTASPPEIVTLASNEKLVGLTGRSGKYIDQISFVLEVENPDGPSTSRTIGPFGSSTGGDPFQIWGETVALYGRSGSKLDAIGSYVNATPTVLCNASGGGSSFQDPVPVPGLSSITRIAIRSATYVDAIATTYRLADGSEKTFSHGGKGGSQQVISLAPGETIVGVEGSTGIYLYGITFHTVDQNGAKHIYGPYGKGGGFPFSFETGIGGFFGRSGDYIDAIGFWQA